MSKPSPGFMQLHCVAVLCLCVVVLRNSAGAQATAQATSTDRPELLVNVGATSLTAMGHIALSPDGQWYATLAADGLQLWSVDLKTEIGHLVRPAQSPLFGIAADSKTIVTLGEQNYAGQGLHTPLLQLDAFTGSEVRRSDIPDLVNSIAASPTEMVVATLGSSNNNVEVRSLADGASLFSDTAADKSPSMYGITMSRIFFSPDGTIVFLSNPERLVGWEWHSGRRVLDLDARVTYSQSLDRQVAVNYSSGKTVSTAREERYNLMTSVNISRDGREVVACSHDELRFFSLDEKERSFHSRGVTVGPPGRIFLSCGFFPGQRYYTVTMSSTNGADRKTTLYDEAGKQETPIKAWIDAVLPIPKRDMSLVVTTSSPPMLVREDGTVLNVALAPPVAASLPVFSEDNRRLWWGAGRNHPLLWDLGSGEAVTAAAINVKGYVVGFSGDGLRLAYNDPNTEVLHEQIDVADVSTSKLLAHFDAYAEYLSFAPALDSKGSEIALIGREGNLHVYKVEGSSNLFTLALTPEELKNVAACLSPDGTLLAVGLPTGVTVYAIPSGKKLAAFAYDAKIPVEVFPQFSPDGSTLAILRFGELLRLVLTKDWKSERHLATVVSNSVAFSPDGKRIAYEATANVDPAKDQPGDNFGSGALVVDDLVTGKHVYQHQGFYMKTAFSEDGRFLVAQGGNAAELIEIATGNMLATMYVFGGDPLFDWVVVAPDGQFDGSPGGWERVSWRMSHSSFEVAPVELFFREFYHPGLLSDLMAGKPRPVVEIKSLDRRQPSLDLRVDGSLQDVTAKQVHVRLTVTESRAPAPQGYNEGAGVRDVRLFRNGTLVKVWRGETALDKGGKAELEADVAVAAGDNRLTAYAFNRANIKSNDASLVVTGADALKREGTAYVLSIGINRYAAAQMSLSYAEADAEDFSSSFAASQKALQQFSKIQTVQLLSEDATRENVLAALRVLSGSAKSTLTAHQQDLLAGFDAVLPEDGVFVFYAGHGEATGDHFYLLPHDFNPRQTAGDARAHAISETDLSEALENISPARAFLIIDACQSGKALETDGAVGPMNSTGLAQLAYEKGLYILAASQGVESALEAPQLAGGHGYLTYALVEDGLKKMDAAQNGIVELRPWFEYASQRVPDLQAALLSGKFNGGKPGGRGITIIDRPSATPAGKENVRVRQHPRMFYRHEPEVTPFVVAETPAR